MHDRRLAPTIRNAIRRSLAMGVLFSLVGLNEFAIADTISADTISADTISADTISEAMPLRPRTEAAGNPVAAEPRSNSKSQAVTTVVGSLAVCLGVFFLVVWAVKRNGPRGLAPLPTEVLESLGRAPIGPRQSLQLIRLGKKLVLLCVTPNGAESVAEVTESTEVERLTGLCLQTRPNSVTNSFREVLTEIEEEPAERSFLGAARKSDWDLANRAARGRRTRETIDG